MKGVEFAYPLGSHESFGELIELKLNVAVLQKSIRCRISWNIYLDQFISCDSTPVPPAATKNKAMQNQHREAPGFAVALLSQQSVLDCTKAQSCLLLLCIFSCWSCKSPGLIFHRASAQWQVQVCLRMLEKFPVCLWLSNFTLLWVAKKYISVIVKCLIEQSEGSVKKPFSFAKIPWSIVWQIWGPFWIRGPLAGSYKTAITFCVSKKC